MTPTHLVDTPGDRDTLCGIRVHVGMVICSVHAAPRHTYQMDRCPDCYQVAGLGHMIPGTIEVAGQLDMFGGTL